MKAKGCLYSQWFPREPNVIADSLSFYFHLFLNNKLTQPLTFTCPHQLPPGFRIKQLVPNKITLWLTLQVCKQLKPMQLPTKPLQSKLAIFIVGWNSVVALTWETTFSLTLSKKKKNFGLLDALPKLCKKAGSALTSLRNYQQARSQRPPHMFLWPFGNPTFDDDGQLYIFLHCQYRGYKNLDPSK